MDILNRRKTILQKDLERIYLLIQIRTKKKSQIRAKGKKNQDRMKEKKSQVRTKKKKSQKKTIKKMTQMEYLKLFLKNRLI
jgi:hypothetical protein